MTKILIDFSKPLPWRDTYVESGMPYSVGRRRVDRFTAGGCRDSNTTISGPRLVMKGKFEVGELQLLTPTARGELNGTEQDYINADWGVFMSGAGDQVVDEVFVDNNSMDDYITIIHSCILNRNLKSCTIIPKVIKHHTNYGLDMIIPDDVRNRLTPGAIFKANERMCHTRSTMASGDLGSGREANCAFISSFSTNEDTCGVLDTVLDDFKTSSYEEFSIPVDNEHVPIDHFGNGNAIKVIPSVGDILKDGRVMSIRRRRPNMHLAHMHLGAIRRSRVPMDTTYYCKRGAEVISVDVIKCTTRKPMNKYLPTEMVAYLDHEAARCLQIPRKIITLDKGWEREKRDSYLRDPSWNIASTQAHKRLYGPKLKEWYKNGYGPHKEASGTIEDNIITGYLIRIKVRSETRPHLGHKFNDPSGAKYTISEIRDKDRMFKDRWGRHAEFITNGVANINRAIWGRLHSQYRGDARFHLLRRTREILDESGEAKAKDYYIRGIRVLSDKTGWLLDNMSEEGLEKHLQYVFHEADFIQVTDEVGDESATITGACKIRGSEFEPPRAALSFTDYRGRKRTTVSPIRIGPLYISVNEKMGSAYNACNIPMLQHSGMTRKLNSGDKKTSQLSYQANRVTSESCFRMLQDSQPAEDAKLILRAGTSIEVLTNMVEAVLDGDKVPDLEISDSDSRGTQIYKSELMCDGVKLCNVPRSVNWEKR